MATYVKKNRRLLVSSKSELYKIDFNHINYNKSDILKYGEMTLIAIHNDRELMASIYRCVLFIDIKDNKVLANYSDIDDEYERYYTDTKFYYISRSLTLHILSKDRQEKIPLNTEFDYSGQVHSIIGINNHLFFIYNGKICRVDLDKYIVTKVDDLSIIFGSMESFGSLLVALDRDKGTIYLIDTPTLTIIDKKEGISKFHHKLVMYDNRFIFCNYENFYIYDIVDSKIVLFKCINISLVDFLINSASCICFLTYNTIMLNLSHRINIYNIMDNKLNTITTFNPIDNLYVLDYNKFIITIKRDKSEPQTTLYIIDENNRVTKNIPHIGSCIKLSDVKAMHIEIPIVFKNIEMLINKFI